MGGCRYLAISILFMSLLTACSDENGMTEQYMEVPDGYGLSAGTSTVFMNTSFAYDSEAPLGDGKLPHAL